MLGSQQSLRTAPVSSGAPQGLTACCPRCPPNLGSSPGPKLALTRKLRGTGQIQASPPKSSGTEGHQVNQRGSHLRPLLCHLPAPLPSTACFMLLGEEARLQKLHPA